MGKIGRTAKRWYRYPFVFIYQYRDVIENPTPLRPSFGKNCPCNPLSTSFCVLSTFCHPSQFSRSAYSPFLWVWQMCSSVITELFAFVGFMSFCGWPTHPLKGSTENLLVLREGFFLFYPRSVFFGTQSSQKVSQRDTEVFY